MKGVKNVVTKCQVLALRGKNMVSELASKRVKGGVGTYVAIVISVIAVIVLGGIFFDQICAFFNNFMTKANTEANNIF